MAFLRRVFFLLLLLLLGGGLVSSSSSRGDGDARLPMNEHQFFSPSKVSQERFHQLTKRFRIINLRDIC